MKAFHNYSSILRKLCVLLFSVLIVSTSIVGCVDKKARSEKNKADLMLKLSELTALQDKAVAMMAAGDVEGAKKFADTSVAEKRAEFASLIEEKAKEQMITPEIQDEILKSLAAKESEYLKKMSPAPKK
jgi:hypothetical protein